MDLRSLDIVFASLQGSGTSHEGFAVIELPPPASARVAIDPWGRRHILFPVTDDQAVQTDTSSSGVHVVDRELLVDGVSRRFVDLACLDSSLNHVFTAVAVEAIAAAEGSNVPDQRALAVLDRWRELFKSGPRGGLTQSERMGLFGELRLLEELSRHSLAAVTAWDGPSKGRHDFVTAVLDIEVKTTLLRTANAVQIHGLEQLTPPESGRLYLAVYVVERVPLGGDRLIDQVARLHAAGVDPTKLFDRLNAASVSSADLDSDDVQLRVNARRVFLVSDTFPRLTAGAMKAWPVTGVVSLQYGIDLGAAPSPLSTADVAAVFAEFTGAMVG